MAADTNWGVNLLPATTETYALGTSSKKWTNVYAQNFYGALTGTASKATADASGNTITSYYAIQNKTFSTSGQLMGVKVATTTHHSNDSAYDNHTFSLIATTTGIFLWDHTGSATVWTSTTMVRTILGIDTTNGSTTKWLTEKGTWATPTAANVGALSTSGGTLTGNIILKHTAVDLKSSTNNLSSTNIFYVYSRDTNDYTFGTFEAGAETDGDVYAYFGVNNRNTSGTAQGWAGMKVTQTKANGITWSVTAADKFRSAISAPSTTGGNASGTWGINITGVSTAVSFQHTSLQITSTTYNTSSNYEKNMGWFGDKDGNGLARLNFIAKTDGTATFAFQVRAAKSDNTVGSFLGITLASTRSNTITCTINGSTTVSGSITASGGSVYSKHGTIDITNSTNALSSNAGTGFYGFDKNGKDYTRCLSYALTSGETRLYLQVRNHNGSAYTTYGGIIIKQGKSENTITYEVTNGANFRSAIGAGTSSLTIGTTATTAAAGNHNHDSTYLKLSGGTMTGTLTLKANQYYYNSVSGINANNSDIIGVNCLQFADLADTFREGIMFYNSSGAWDCLAANGGAFYFRSATDGTPAVSSANANGKVYAATFYGALSGNATSATSATHAGYVTWTADADCTKANNGGTNIDRTALRSNDTNGNIIMRLRTYIYGTGDNAGQVLGQFVVRNYNTSTGAWGGYGGISIYALKDGTFTYGVSSAANFRSAIGVGASGTHADSYFALASHGTHVTAANVVAVLNPNFTITVANHSNDDGMIINNTTSGSPLKIGYIIGSSGNGGIYDYTHSAWKVKIATDGTTTFTGNASTATRINGNLGAISSNTNCNIWVSSTGSADGIPKYVSGVYVNASTASLYATKVYNAVWNDYAECREVETEEPGYCVTETSNGKMIKTDKRLQAGCKITSDTYGTCMGETTIAKTPIAVAGRVLVYPYRPRSEYALGAAVCSAPNGTVDIMTRDEIMMYPERIVGTVSEIPTYDTWHGGNQDGNNDININGRIWIYVR